ncbi:MAG TPA: DUF2914 domain-containing protein [candidate division Zixibacteria bacterium]|nr:DUF2914 domain-containing protein [candidate division Zixibacteria bacterium]
MGKLVFSFLAVLLILVAAGAAQTGDEATPDKTTGITIEAVLCSDVVDRLPTGEADSFGDDIGKVCLWTRVKGAVDTTFIKHNWYFEGKEMASVELSVKSANWRTYSSKNILPEWDGNWEVKVVDASGQTLVSKKFTVTRTEKQ